jgi:lipoprotein NlpD
MRKIDERGQRQRKGLLLALAALLGGCGGGSLAPVEDGGGQSLREPSAQIVSGDTLYSFAWRYGFDYREIAAWNGLNPPYTVHAGQRLRLLPATASLAGNAGNTAPAAKVETAAASAPAPVQGSVRSSPATAAAAAAPDLAPTPTTAVPSAVPAVRANSPAPAPAKAPPAPLAQNEWIPPEQAPSGWLWPLDNAKVVRGFDSLRPGGRGLDLQAAPGAQVRASAPGKVVYEGSGLPGYGRLIILKHTESLLSAYGHLGGFHVKEGDIVKSGQVLADLSTGGGKDAPVLRFEIRQDGQPRNPLAFLPG